MATPKGGVIRQFTQGMIDRITGRSSTPAVNADTGSAATPQQMNEAFTPARQYFGPAQPMRPVAPAGTTTGRQFDYATAINQNYTPRLEPGQGGISAAVLRRLTTPAEGGLDLLRLAIETRKDQMVAQRWAIRGRAKNDDGGKRARDLEQLLRRPDGVMTFRQWMRMLLEDHYVIDAPTIYYGGSTSKRPRLEIIDGGTIKRVIDVSGRTPLAPLPAYQQIIKGTPAEDYTVDEIGYYVSNPLPYRLYGMSRVEQVLVIVNMAIQRALSQLDYFTEGTTPDGFIEVPKEWTVEQIAQYAEWFNSILQGQSGERRRLQFVPSGANYKPTKDAILKDVFDEWLARIICYAFSLPPQALVKETNRATAETNKQAAAEEGLEPDKLWFKDMMDDALERIGASELEWHWMDDEIVDPRVRAEVVMTYRGGNGVKPIITVDEAREMAAIPPLSDEQRAELEAESAPAIGAEQQDGGEGKSGDSVRDSANNSDRANKKGDKSQSTKAATSRGGRSLPPLKRNTKLADKTAAAIESLATEILGAQRKALQAAIADRLEKFAKAESDDVAELIREIIADGWDDDARQKLWDLLAELSADRAAAALEQIEPYVDSKEFAAALTQANERAVEWARFRSTNLITAVNDTTRQIANELTASAIEDGLTNTELASTLSDAFGFSRERAEMIARTETAFAETAGTIEGYRASGVVGGKQWSADPDACDECAALDGVTVDLDEDFPDEGGDGPPLHPNCLCTVVAVLTAEAEELIVDAEE